MLWVNHFSNVANDLVTYLWCLDRWSVHSIRLMHCITRSHSHRNELCAWMCECFVYFSRKCKHKSFLVARQWQIVSFYPLLYSSVLCTRYYEICMFERRNKIYICVSFFAASFRLLLLFQHIRFEHFFEHKSIAPFLYLPLLFRRNLLSYPNSSLRSKSHTRMCFDYKNQEMNMNKSRKRNFMA